jgi:alcohol dehydrogenase (NADP+)
MRTLVLANGEALPALGLGTWRVEPGQVGGMLRRALELGYRHIDAAAIYGNEAEIGVALERAMADGVVRREELWITSKLWNDSHAPEDVRPALERTLADLRLSWLDLYLIHWPVVLRHGVRWPQRADDLVPLERLPLARTWAAMEALRVSGLCRHIGVSNLSLAKLRALLTEVGQPPAMLQVEGHPWLQQPQLLAFCQGHGIALTAYSPLGAGRDQQPSPVLADPELVAIAREVGASPAQVALAWGLARGTAVIPKAVRPDHPRAGVGGCGAGSTGAAGSAAAVCGGAALVAAGWPLQRSQPLGWPPPLSRSSLRTGAGCSRERIGALAGEHERFGVTVPQDRQPRTLPHSNGGGGGQPLGVGGAQGEPLPEHAGFDHGAVPLAPQPILEMEVAVASEQITPLGSAAAAAIHQQWAHGDGKPLVEKPRQKHLGEPAGGQGLKGEPSQIGLQGRGGGGGHGDQRLVWKRSLIRGRMRWGVPS